MTSAVHDRISVGYARHRGPTSSSLPPGGDARRTSTRPCGPPPPGSLVDQTEVDRGIARLAADLRCGAWAARQRELLALEELDVRMRIVVSEAPR